MSVTLPYRLTVLLQRSPGDRQILLKRLLISYRNLNGNITGAAANGGVAAIAAGTVAAINVFCFVF